MEGFMKKKYADWEREYPDVIVIRKEGYFYTTRNDGAEIVGKLLNYNVAETDSGLITGSPALYKMTGALRLNKYNYVVIEKDTVIEIYNDGDNISQRTSSSIKTEEKKESTENYPEELIGYIDTLLSGKDPWKGQILEPNHLVHNIDMQAILSASKRMLQLVAKNNIESPVQKELVKKTSKTSSPSTSTEPPKSSTTVSVSNNKAEKPDFYIRKEHRGKFRYSPSYSLNELLKELNNLGDGVKELSRDNLRNTLIALDFVWRDGTEEQFTLRATEYGRKHGVMVTEHTSKVYKTKYIKLFFGRKVQEAVLDFYSEGSADIFLSDKKDSAVDVGCNETKETENSNALRCIKIGDTVKLLDYYDNSEVSYTIILSHSETKYSAMGYNTTNYSHTIITSDADGISTISDESPIGKALLGRKIGDDISYNVPHGDKQKFKVIDIL